MPGSSASDLGFWMPSITSQGSHGFLSGSSQGRWVHCSNETTLKKHPEASVERSVRADRTSTPAPPPPDPDPLPGRRRLRTMALVLTAVLASGGVGYGASGLRADEPAAEGAAPVSIAVSDDTPSPSSLADTVETVLPSVVNIKVTSVGVGPFGTEERQGEGSGVIISQGRNDPYQPSRRRRRGRGEGRVRERPRARSREPFSVPMRITT